jgi:hypothetical protein
MIRPGQTFLVPSGPRGNHLFIVALGPMVLPQYGRQPHFVLVSATTIYDGIPHDDACLLRPGDHPFILHDSYIFYQQTRLEPVEHVEHHGMRGKIVPKNCSTASWRAYSCQK